MKKHLLLITALSFTVVTAFGQLQINTAGTPEMIDFTGFDGSGFNSPTVPGQLNSETWSAIGFSDGDVLFSGTGTTGDFARGTSAGGETTGGVYAFDDAGDVFLGVQPGGSDFTPGNFILKVENNTGAPLFALEVTYDIKVLNNEERANSFNFSHSADNITFTDEASLDFVSTEVSDVTPAWTTENRTITLSGLNIPAGDFYYLSWNSDDVSGAGSRDEMGVDNIEVIGKDIDITASAPDACLGEAINFTSTTNGGQAPFTYAWDFNGEGNSTDENPTFTFNTSGTKTIIVGVIDGNGATTTYEFEIDIFDAPQAMFNASALTGCEDLDVTFTDNSTAPGGQTITAWSWNFDNGNTSTVQNPPQETFSAGSYDVSLEVTTDAGCTNTVIETIDVDPQGDASFSYPSATVCDQDANPMPTVTGDAGGTFSSTAGIDIDASTGEIDLANTTLGNYTITYTTAGPCANSETFDIEITGALDATISGNNDLCEDDDPVILTAADGGGTWSADCGICIDASTGEFDPLVSGVGTFTIDYVIAGACGASDQVSLTVNESPTADFTYTGETLNGGEVSFTNTSTGNAFNSWDFDDGNTSTDENPTNTYASGGVYLVCLIVESADGCIDEYCETITVDTDNASVNNWESNSVKIYPNPSGQENVTIEMDNAEFSYEVVDVTGKVLFTGNKIQDKVTLNFSNESAGLYFVKVTNKELTNSYKLIVK